MTSNRDRARLALAGLIAPPGALMRESMHEEGYFTCRKFYADDDLARATPYEVVESDCNLLLTSGANGYHERLIGTATTIFSSANARIAVGDSTTAVTAAQTDLQAATNKFRKIVDAQPTVVTNTISFVATFGTSDANFTWNEAGIAGAASAGLMLNRVVQNFGTKTSSLVWVMTGTISLT